MSMKSTEGTLGNELTRWYQWSPQLKLLVSRYRYWTLWLKLRNGGSIPPVDF
jgi:hypothetical protein